MSFSIMDINYVDILFLLILIVSVLFAFSRGIVKEIFSTGNWIISGWLAFKYYLEIQPYFLEYISPEILADISSFSSLFIIFLFIGTLVNQFISSRVKNSVFAPLDKILGLFFGILRALILISIIVLLANNTIWKNKSLPVWLTSAYSFPIIKESSDLLVHIFPYSSSLLDGENLDLEKLKQNGVDKVIERLIDPPINNSPNEDGYNASEREAMDRLLNLETTDDTILENNNE